jgi:hypothetical protein
VNEAEWLACADPTRMLGCSPGRLSTRTLLLWQVACCRRMGTIVRSKWLRQAISVMEQVADGDLPYSSLRGYSRERWEAFPALNHAGLWETAEAVLVVVERPDYPSYASVSVVEAVTRVAHVAERAAVRETEQRGHCDLVRDIIGNPFRPVSFDPAWRTETAVAVASQMYESRDFGAMPILADALQDAGCTSEDILNHCRGPGPHVRGCWVVDLVLGKE